MDRRFSYRPLRPDDAKSMAAYFVRNKEAHAPWVPVRPPEFYTEEFHRTMLADDKHTGRARRIGCLLDGAVVGIISIDAIEYGVFCNARIGYSVDSLRENIGIATNLVRLAVMVAQEDLGLHRLEAAVMPANIGSAKVLEKNGFSAIGLSPRHLRIAGSWSDHIIYSRIFEQSEG